MQQSDECPQPSDWDPSYRYILLSVVSATPQSPQPKRQVAWRLQSSLVVHVPSKMRPKFWVQTLQAMVPTGSSMVPDLLLHRNVLSASMSCCPDLNPTRLDCLHGGCTRTGSPLLTWLPVGSVFSMKTVSMCMRMP